MNPAESDLRSEIGKSLRRHGEKARASDFTDSALDAFKEVFVVWAERRAAQLDQTRFWDMVEAEVAKRTEKERAEWKDKVNRLNALIAEAVDRSPTLRAAIEEGRKIREYAEDSYEKSRAITASALMFAAAVGLTHYGTFAHAKNQEELK